MLTLVSIMMKTTQEGSFIIDYIQDIKIIIDDLAFISHPLSDEEVTIHILNGLGDEYKKPTSIIHVWDSSMSFKELYDKLIDH